jgi:hypothetical protein
VYLPPLLLQVSDSAVQTAHRGNDNSGGLLLLVVVVVVVVVVLQSC